MEMIMSLCEMLFLTDNVEVAHLMTLTKEDLYKFYKVIELFNSRKFYSP